MLDFQIFNFEVRRCGVKKSCSIKKTERNYEEDNIYLPLCPYGIDGKRRDILHHGLNIVRSNGKARKVMKN